MDHHKSGSVIGGILLITGSCIGAGMLALPVVTGLAGFFPSTLLFILAWLFMTTSALLLLEANLALGHHLSLISLAEKTLGRSGKILVWVLFLFLFYSLNIAYIAASGDIVSSVISDLTGIVFPPFLGSLLFTLLFGVVIYLGTRPVDLLNRILMGGLIASYVLLVAFGLPEMKISLLKSATWKYALGALPILIISFGFHNMVPTLAEYCHGDRKKLRLIIFLGSLIPLAIYLIWEAILLGIIPIEGRGGLKDALSEGEAVTLALRELLGRSWVASLADAFSLFAITTSFLAQSLSLVDFLADGLKIKKVGSRRVALVAVALLPAFLFAFVYPGIFIEALNFAGGFSAVILFGAIPAIMVYKLRKKHQTTPIVFGGNAVLFAILVFSLFIFALQSFQELGA